MEVWKPIKDYEQLYEISNLGKVRRLDCLVKRGNNEMLVKGGEMQLRDNGKGYLRVKLTKDNKSRRILIHRLLAEHFIPQPLGLTIINHIDGNKQNNSITNLEWTTQKENVRHARETGLINMENWRDSISKAGKKMVKNLHKLNSKEVINTENGEIYESIVIAAQKNGICRTGLGKKLRGLSRNNTNLKLIEKYKAA